MPVDPELLVPRDWPFLLRQGGTWRRGDVLGVGAEGVVYLLVPEGGDQRRLALKWYFPENAYPARRASLGRLTEMRAPSDAFMWPMEVVDWDVDRFGYVMPVIPDGYVLLADLLNSRVDVPFSTIATLCLGLADSFLQLHAEGLCYRDISLLNVFFHPATGRPAICDNDNVGIDGDEPARVLGTARFMAPEIVRGEAQPSTATDLYSLAVLIFYLLMVHHPLQGRRELDFPCLDRAAEADLFGAHPLFVFDPVDDSNGPDPITHSTVLRYWPLYPTYVRTEFVRAFTIGLTEPQLRVRETMWRRCMSRLLDGIVLCACKAENFTEDGIAGTCWSCGADIPNPVRLEIGGGVLVLNAGAKVTRHHIERDYDYATVIGEVVPHPQRPGVWGLTNRSNEPWQATMPDGASQQVDPGRSIGLVPGTRLQLGRVTGLLTV